MTDKLSSFFAELSSRKEELNSIISSLQEGLLVLDKKGAIVLSNESIKKIAHDVPFDGKYYWEVIREPQFNALVDSLSSEQKSCTTEILINGQTFLCSATSLGEQEKTVVMFHDITESQEGGKDQEGFCGECIP